MGIARTDRKVGGNALLSSVHNVCWVFVCCVSCVECELGLCIETPLRFGLLVTACALCEVNVLSGSQHAPERLFELLDCRVLACDDGLLDKRCG
jgi:hypothetical protein